MLKPEKNEIRKPTKTISGITPVAIMLPPRRCDHGCCIYCPNLGVPQSYTPKSPVVLRAKELNYDSFKQVQARIEAFEIMNHPTDKIEIIIMGGTFLQYSEKFQNNFIKGIYDGLNNEKSKNLANAQKLNEKSKHRCVALCVETRPDICVKFINKMRQWGVTRVELGVQIIDDKIYNLIKRGHSVQDVVDATLALKNAGFKIGYHIMPGLPGSNLKKDLQLFKKLFSDSKFKPDQLKIYPCQVMPCSELEKMYWNKKYLPYTKEETEKILIQMLKTVPRYCRVMRIMREIHPDYIVAGTKKIDLRADIERELKKKNSKIKEIRYREIGFALRDGEKINNKLKLKITKYKASNGEEYFLEIVNSQNILFGLLRLRIFGEDQSHQSNSQPRSNVDSPREVVRPRPPSPDIASLRSGLMASRLSSTKRFAEKIVNPTKKFIDKVNNNNNKIKYNNKNYINSSKLFRGATETSNLSLNEEKIAIIREVHVYGQSLKLGEEGKISQHRGFGKWLIAESEKIAKKEKCKKLKIISGIGVREYYEKLGYKLEESYMVKEL